MPLCLELVPNRCHLLILGGGPQALKKALSFVEEGAAVTVRSLTFCVGLQVLADAHPCPPGRAPAPGQLKLLEGRFAPADFTGCHLFLAATGDAGCDRKALAEAASRGVLAFSIHSDPAVCAHFLRAGQSGGLTLAAGTGGQYPALLEPLLETMTEAARPFGQRLPLLAALRPRILALDLSPGARAEALRRLALSEPEELSHLDSLTDVHWPLLCKALRPRHPGAEALPCEPAITPKIREAVCLRFWPKAAGFLQLFRRMNPLKGGSCFDQAGKSPSSKMFVSRRRLRRAF